jgi:hypothetical protein
LAFLGDPGSSLLFPSPGMSNWRDLYSAALRETDAAKLPGRLAEAKDAIILRIQELATSRTIDGEFEEIMAATREIDNLSPDRFRNTRGK